MTDLTTLSLTDLQSLIDSAKAEIARKANSPLRVTATFGGYNSRRYSRPWIGRVTSWAVGGRPEIEFGSYLGTDKGGETEVIARPGDIIRYGQKDNRNANGTENNWAVVEIDGTLRRIEQSEARSLYR